MELVGGMFKTNKRCSCKDYKDFLWNRTKSGEFCDLTSFWGEGQLLSTNFRDFF